MTNYSDIMKSLLGEINNEFGFSTDINSSKLIALHAKSVLYLLEGCENVIAFIPDLNVAAPSEEEAKSVIASMKIVRNMFIESKKRTEDTIFWINQYLTECSKYGESS